MQKGPRFVVQEDMQKRTRFGTGPLLGSLAGQMPKFPGLVHFSVLLQRLDSVTHGLSLTSKRLKSHQAPWRYVAVAFGVLEKSRQLAPKSYGHVVIFSIMCCASAGLAPDLQKAQKMA